jgi:hypothetical protein
MMERGMGSWIHGFTDSDHYMLQHDYVPIEGRGSSIADAEWCGVDGASDGAFARDPRRDRSPSPLMSGRSSRLPLVI